MEYRAITEEQKAGLTINDIEKVLAAVIEAETGAIAEVLVFDDTTIHTENVECETAIITLMQESGFSVNRISRYEADEDFPESIALVFKRN